MRLGARAFPADEFEKGHGTDAIRARQPQTGQTFHFGQSRQDAGSFLAPKRGSCPFSNRLMFS